MSPPMAAADPVCTHRGARALDEIALADRTAHPELFVRSRHLSPNAPLTTGIDRKPTADPIFTSSSVDGFGQDGDARRVDT